MKTKDDPIPADILIVDDTPANLQLLSGMLKECGYKVRLAISGELALKSARHSPPDLILLDITMPGLSGYDVAVQLKAEKDLGKIPIIFISALTEPLDKVRAFAVGGVDYVTKPFHFEEVAARVKNHLEIRRLHSELEQRNVELTGNYQRLQELETLRDKLVHMVVHDMRSPLMVASCNLELMQMSLDGPTAEKNAEILSDAMGGLARLTSMTNDLLDISKMEGGKMAINPQPCDLAVMAGEVAESISALDSTRTISVDDGKSAKASCDVGLTRRILQNLLSNAVKHTPDGSAVRVTVREVPRHVRVSVIDAGPGVPVESRAKIFEKFGALETRAQHKYHSVGLGLAFCKLAVEAHGGRIGVESNEPQGSVFWFELPK